MLNIIQVSRYDNIDINIKNVLVKLKITKKCINSISTIFN